MPDPGLGLKEDSKGGSVLFTNNLSANALWVKYKPRQIGFAQFGQLHQTHLYQHPFRSLCAIPNCQPQRPNLEGDF